VNKDKTDEISFRWDHNSSLSKKVDELKGNKFLDEMHPFNGTLIPRQIIEKIGYIKKEMFIWGDEEEYMARTKKNGYGCYTVTSAIHYHPKEKGRSANVIPFLSKYTLLVKPTTLSHIFYRNKGFLYSNYPEKRKDRTKYIMANVVHDLTHLKIKELVKFVVYFRRGAKNNYE
jgi:rhamnopyranosyl-N-acetylglucosaminyl-diphospho-decaprenol beta-1,3/1,4-galactofuranosyltransferase